MYIKLGSTKINYYQSRDDFMIFSEVISSGISYESPVLVRTVNELDIWFGRDFPEYNYLRELLRRGGVTLYLYRPVRSEQNIYDANYLDCSSFQVDPVLYYRSQDLPYPGNENTRYKLVNNISGENEDSGGTRFDYYIWYQSRYTIESELPQNLNNNTESLNNRDTLTLTYPGFNGPDHYYPKYIKDSEKIEYLETIDPNGITNNTGLPWDVVVNKITLGYYSLAFDLLFKESEFLNTEKDQYIILENPKGENVLIYFCEDQEDIPPISVSDKYYTETMQIIKSSDNIGALLKVFKSYGYQVENKGIGEYLIYTSKITRATYFNNLIGFEIEPNFRVTHNLISKYCTGFDRLQFASKLIGSEENEEGLISVTVEDIGHDNYRVTVEKYNYSEVFEGSILNNLGANRIDFKITNESKLVSCNLIETYLDVRGYEVSYNSPGSERTKTLPTGTWKLRGGRKEKYSPEMYWNAVDCIFNDGDTIYFDYFLVPDRKLFTSGLNKDYNYFTEYKKFLNYAKLIECQVLIQNSDNPWKKVKIQEIPKYPEPGVVYSLPNGKYMAIINETFQETTDREIIEDYQGDYIFNYIEDPDNRLIYFYRPIEVYGNQRPGYYLYISGLLSNVFSASGNYIKYQSPVNDPYLDYETLESELIKYKSNYLVDNNHIYYYKTYQSGENPNTTGWMRFCIGKLVRELEKNKWEFLALRDVGVIKRKITGITERILNSFSIIRRIDITNFSFQFQENKLELSIDTEISDLVSNNLSLDITLNYNKQD